LLPIFWIFVFLFQKKTNKFLFLSAIDLGIIIILFILQTKYALIIFLLMLIMNSFVFILPGEDIGFEKKDIFFVISLALVLPVLFLLKRHKSILLPEITTAEQLQIVFLFFLFSVACFFILREIFSKTEGKND